MVSAKGKQSNQLHKTREIKTSIKAEHLSIYIKLTVATVSLAED